MHGHYFPCVIVYVVGSRLQNRQRDEWGEIVTIVSCDMRLWAAPEKVHMYLEIRVLMRDEKEGRKKQASQTNKKAKQHSTPKAITYTCISTVGPMFGYIS